MKIKFYSGDLPNWTAVQSRFGIKRPEPHFVFTVVGSRYGKYLALAAYSDDGVSFSAAAVTKDGREAMEVITRPLQGSRWQDVARRLGGISPVAEHHRGEIGFWVEHVRPPVVPELVSLDGPDSQVLRLLRNALGLSGTKLREMLCKSRLMQVDVVQFHALAYWAPRFPRVTITVEVHDARA